MKHKSKLIAFIFILAVLSTNSSAQGVYDIFPLSSGMNYKYTFYQENKYYELMYLIEILSDSGEVEYTVIDSLQYGDTLKVWNIEQKRKLLHYRFYAPSWDTTYFIDDTNYYSLYEYLGGNHEIKCSSMVWQFPLSVWGNIEYGKSSGRNIYRYSDSTNLINVLSNHDPYGNSGWEDSIWFSIDAGMYRRITDTYWVSISQEYYKRYLQRSDIPIDVKQSDGNVVKDYILYQNYPNPFNPTTTIKYQIPELRFITLKLYDVLGNEVATLVNEEKPAGSYEIDFNGNELTSGIYFYQLRADDPESSSEQGFVETKKMILLR